MIVSQNIRERCFTTGTRENKWRLHRAFTAYTLVTRFFTVMITTVKNSDNEKKLSFCTRKLEKLSIGYFVSLKFSWFYFVFKGNSPSTSPWAAYIWRGDLREGFFALSLWGAYIWRGLYTEGLIFRILRYLCLKIPTGWLPTSCHFTIMAEERNFGLLTTNLAGRQGRTFKLGHLNYRYKALSTRPSFLAHWLEHCTSIAKVNGLTHSQA